MNTATRCENMGICRISIFTYISRTFIFNGKLNIYINLRQILIFRLFAKLCHFHIAEFLSTKVIYFEVSIQIPTHTLRYINLSPRRH